MAEKSTAKKNRVAVFFKDLKTEIKKVMWPGKEQTFKQMIAVVVISAFLSAFIRLIDVLSQLAVGAVSSIF